MKQISITLLLLLTINIFSQNYTKGDFELNGDVKRISVLCYDYELIDGDYTEGLPYSNQTKYHTDLNLHYLEFDNDGKLKRSLLYYPRDFYGQFSWLQPEFKLESSDFGPKKNYLGSMFRYKYIESDEYTSIVITGEDSTEINLKIDSNDMLTEDEYYTYTESVVEDKIILTKRRKGSDYGFRRKETVTVGNKMIVSEYINNRFLVSKKVVIELSDTKHSIFVSQSRIELQKDIIDSSGKLVQRSYVDLSWRNKFLKWPELDFDSELDYDSFLKMLERESDEYGVEYIYNEENQLIEKNDFKLGYDNKIPLRSTKFIYNNDLISRITIDPDPQVRSETYFKEYVYDAKGNWIEKIIGIEKVLKGELVRVPAKKYVKTLTYWN